mmetsp:Transcript_59943/g.107889  ORF Transcript_59943/g.107889 Transcript_59943/m.107889 type:complete len:121 (-) Transcript_59943:64-426(-)
MGGPTSIGFKDQAAIAARLARLIVHYGRRRLQVHDCALWHRKVSRSVLAMANTEKYAFFSVSSAAFKKRGLHPSVVTLSKGLNQNPPWQAQLVSFLRMAQILVYSGRPPGLYLLYRNERR